MQGTKRSHIAKAQSPRKLEAGDETGKHAKKKAGLRHGRRKVKRAGRQRAPLTEREKTRTTKQLRGGEKHVKGEDNKGSSEPGKGTSQY